MNELVGKQVWVIETDNWGVADTTEVFSTREKGIDYIHKEAERCDWEILKEENERGYTWIEVKAEDGGIFHFVVGEYTIH
jgi:hypothetical protein